MQRIICKSKIHRATVTEANVAYTGSLTLDAQLMQAADLRPYEQVHVLNLRSGARIQTYCIEGPAGSGTVCVNGAAAHLMSVGDKIIILSYAQMTDEELESFSPKMILLDAANRIQQVFTDAYQLTAEDAAKGPSLGSKP